VIIIIIIIITVLGLTRIPLGYALQHYSAAKDGE
jgi:hypothetical protein